MTTPDSLLVERPSDDIVVFRFNRPQVRNALNLEVRTRLADEVTRHAADEKIRCLIVTGSDAVFAAGSGTCCSSAFNACGIQCAWL